MQTKRVTRLIAAAVLAALAIALAACGGSSSDKAGGADKAKPRVLTMASGIGAPAQLADFVEELSRLSDGTLEIEFKEEWRLGEPDSEAGTIEDAETGKVEMAWVGARAFDTVGVTSFQALVAPLLIDSYDLEAKVFELGIPERMLEGVDQLDLVGIGVLPGPMRKLLGMSQPFVRPGDFAGQVVGIQGSVVAEKTLMALGATPRPVPAQASLDGLDAYEQQLDSIAGNQYDRGAKYVTANVNLWTRPLVIVMNKEAYASLTDEQQSALRDAAAAAIPGALAASRAEDDKAAPVLCRRGMTFAAASGSELAELRRALEPVYAELAADPEIKSDIDAITDLKTEIAASAEAPTCALAEPPVASAIPEGTYETKLTKGDWLKGGVSEEEASQSAGVYRMIFAAGELTILEPNGEPGFVASYTVFRDQIEAQANAEYTISARWSLQGETLTFTDIDCCGGDAMPETVTWASHPWVKTD